MKSDGWIRRMAVEQKMIEPFEPESVRGGKISFGLSSYGYDIRLSNEFLIFTGASVDPKQFDESAFERRTGDHCIIPPNAFILGRSLEYFRMPRGITGIAFGKSTYARCGIVCNVTPLEAGWEGHLTLAISNTAPAPAKLYANEGICQVLFFEGDEACVTSYADRKGKYQAQRGISLPRV